MGKDKDVPPEETQRIICVGRPDDDRCDNKISTSKYNILTFLPVVRTFLRVVCTSGLFVRLCMASTEPGNVSMVQKKVESEMAGQWWFLLSFESCLDENSEVSRWTIAVSNAAQDSSLFSSRLPHSSTHNGCFLYLQATKEQFRRVANLYFLIIGIIMAIGWYTEAFDSAISPWTTLGPLAIVISFSLLQEGTADYGRHKSDANTNNYPCVVLQRAEVIDESEGHEKRDETINHGEDVSVDLRKAYFTPYSKNPATPTISSTSTTIKIAFESVARQDIRAGNLVLVRNREMVPADIILLASSSENGSAYIETSSIDGETNLKLRTSPHLPKNVVQIVRNQSSRDLAAIDDEQPIITEDLDQATRRLTRMSALAYPDGKNVLENPLNAPPSGQEVVEEPHKKPTSFLRRVSMKGGEMMKDVAQHVGDRFAGPDGDGNVDVESILEEQETYIAALKSESPNASVNTYSGVLTMPPIEVGGPGIDIPLNADNMLLRGAVLRNTEWVIGLACFTGTDTKLVQNSFDTPSKFSQLDKLMNWTVICILFVMICCITVLATLGTITTNQNFDNMW